MAKKQNYGNESIAMLKGADRVRKRPAVIFGSDGLDGCEHAVFEILSNAIDEAREGYGDLVIVTRYEDHSIEVEDFGRGCPVDWNEKEQRYNWELVFCELYAGGKAQKQKQAQSQRNHSFHSKTSFVWNYTAFFRKIQALTSSQNRAIIELYNG